LIFLALLLSIAMAGFNSGNNLLFLISGVMLGALFVSYAAGRINISRLEARRSLPRYAFAGHPFRVIRRCFSCRSKAAARKQGAGRFCSTAGGYADFLPLC